jgi:hypothetical protein
MLADHDLNGVARPQVVPVLALFDAGEQLFRRDLDLAVGLSR